MVKALIFDVFGTLVDWRTSVASQARRLLSPVCEKNSLCLDWFEFADAWRDQYQPSMQKVRSAQVPFSPLDALHLMNLQQILKDFSLSTYVGDELVHELNRAWHYLDGWPDTTTGLARLRKKFIIAPCSNANFSLMIDLARHNHICWDAVLGAQIANNYKPHPVVYQASVKALGLMPDEVMMVAAHSSDLHAASEQGLKTAFISRPQEHGPPGSRNHHQAEPQALCPVDYSALDLHDLANQLTC
jgi:2-haloacid dehalogenase